MVYDKLIMRVDPKYETVFQAEGSDLPLILPRDGSVISIRPQLPNTELTRSLQTGASASSTNLKIILVLSFLMN